MKKVIISQPMRGKTVAQIKEERKDLIALLQKKGYEVEDTVITDDSHLNSDDRHCLWCLGKVLSMIAAMDAVVFMDGWEQARGCVVEHTCCESYNVPIIYAKDL